MESGILPGGGSALLFASQTLKDIKTANIDQDAGVKIIERACMVPIKTIAQNAGLEGSLIAGNLLQGKDEFGRGFDALSGEYKNMFEAGIIDPTKVVLTALNDASSIASLMCTTEAAVFTPKQPTQAAGEDKTRYRSHVFLVNEPRKIRNLSRMYTLCTPRAMRCSLFRNAALRAANCLTAFYRNQRRLS